MQQPQQDPARAQLAAGDEVAGGEIAYWGTIKDIALPVQWDHGRHMVLFHLLSADEEQDVLQRVRDWPPDERQWPEARYRMAYAIRGVDGKAVSFGGDLYNPDGTINIMELVQRFNWTGTFKGRLLDGCVAMYEVAAGQPLEELQKNLADPLS